MDMPKSVRYAIRSMYAGVACYFASNALSIAQVGGSRIRGDAQFMLFLVTLILCAVYCLLVSRIAERSKLARILLSIVGVLAALNLAANTGQILKLFASDPLVIALDVAANCLQVTAIVLLFLPASRDWFRRPEVQNSSNPQEG